MKQEKKVFALTGITGLLGSNVFFEIIKDNLKDLDNVEIIVLGRSSEKEKLSERVKKIFYSEGIDYLGIDPNNLNKINAFFETNITFINIELSSAELITEAERAKLIGRPINYFLHIAAATDFRNDEQTVERLYQMNVKGTANILQLCSGLDIKEFGYVSSAYVCGRTYGNIAPDYVNLNQEFRNPYEKSKLQGEMLVKEFQKRTGMRCRIFRPSTISGRLIENKKGAINKFDVFYGWASFFLKWKMQYCSNFSTIYDEIVEIDLRIIVNENAGLNIVPVDFAAKTLYQVCKQNLEGEYFHLVNEQETAHTFYINKLIEICNVKGVRYVDGFPKDMNPFESFYYSKVGEIFFPYVNQEAILFNTDNLREMYNAQNLHCPQIDEDNFQLLLDYAKSKNFGVKPKKAVNDVLKGE